MERRCEFRMAWRSRLRRALGAIAALQDFFEELVDLVV